MPVDLTTICTSPENPGTISSGTGCSKGGIDKIYYSIFSDVDWDNVGWDGTNWRVTSYAMNATKVFEEITFDFESAQYNFVKDEATGLYTNEVNITILGKDKANWLPLMALGKMCGLVFHIIGMGCESRIVGVGHNGTNFKLGDVRALDMPSHQDTSETPSGEGKEVLVFRSKSRYTPFYTDVAEGAIPT